VPSGRAYLPSR
jgi:hypothetical protein